MYTISYYIYNIYIYISNPSSPLPGSLWTDRNKNRFHDLKHKAISNQSKSTMNF